jgi:hypothetical protein
MYALGQLAAGTIVGGDYRVVSLLAEGGMGQGGERQR